MPGGGPDETDLGTVGKSERRAVGGQPVRRAVQVQENEPPRRVAEVMDPRDGLLAAVAPLVQVHGGLDEADLMRQGLVVGVEPGPRDARRDPGGLEGPQAGDGVGRRQPRRRGGRGDQVGAERAVEDGGHPAFPAPPAHPIGQGGTGAARARVGQDPSLGRERAGQRQHPQLRRQVLDRHPEHEAHRVQVVDEGLRGMRLDVDPGGSAVVGEGQVVL